jgi:hypothetical protein
MAKVKESKPTHRQQRTHRPSKGYRIGNVRLRILGSAAEIEPFIRENETRLNTKE